MPTNEIIVTPGIRYIDGIFSTLVNMPTIGRFSASNMKLPMNSAAIRPQTTSGFCANSKGPGVMSMASNMASRLPIASCVPTLQVTARISAFGMLATTAHGPSSNGTATL